ncbi:MAG: DHH family phosphoesterase [Bacteroidia bacterium]
MEWKEALLEAKRLFCLSHPRPDGDAVGALLGIYHTLRAQGKEVLAVLPDPVPQHLRFLPGWEAIAIWSEAKEAILAAAREADLFICVDFGKWDRIDEALQALIDPARLIWVDHHADSLPLSAQWNFWEPAAAATCELLYETILEPFRPLAMPARLALYTGLITDTGGFRFRSVTPRTLQIAAELIQPPFPLEAVHHYIFQRKKLSTLRLQAYLIQNYLQKLDDLPVLLLPIPASELERFGVDWEEVETLPNQILALEGVLLAVVLKEYPEATRISLRSVGDFPCHEVAQHFDKGGGHRNAAGATLYRSLEESLTFTKQLLQEVYASRLLADYRAFLERLALHQLQ